MAGGIVTAVVYITCVLHSLPLPPFDYTYPTETSHEPSQHVDALATSSHTTFALRRRPISTA